MSTLDTAEVIQRFNRAFIEHDPSLLNGLVGDTCLMEAIQPAPEGARYQGRKACLEFWQSLAQDQTAQFEPEEVIIACDRATIRWRYRYGAGPLEYIRGVNLMRVQDGAITEALGYSKTTGSSQQLEELLQGRAS